MSVVVSCSNDYHVFETIDSIDENVEIVCSLTPNRLIERLLAERKIPYCITPRGNHSVTVNAGVGLSSHPKVILIDSDCVFGRGSIRLLARSLDEYEAVNARVVFQSHDLISDCIGRCRDFDYGVGYPDYDSYGPPLFRPGIGFHRSLIERLGGLFDPRIPWTEDAELTYRLHRAGVPIRHVADAIVYHLPVRLRHHFRAYYFYGKGDKLREMVLGQYCGGKTTARVARRCRAVLKQPARTALAVLASDVFYWIGYVSMRDRHTRR